MHVKKRHGVIAFIAVIAIDFGLSELVVADGELPLADVDDFEEVRLQCREFVLPGGHGELGQLGERVSGRRRRRRPCGAGRLVELESLLRDHVVLVLVQGLQQGD